jgi:hypothetical protein
VSTSFFTLPDPGSTGLLPDQLAACLSYGADLTGLFERGPVVTRPTDEEGQDEGAPATHPARSRPAAQARGRIYFGPLSTFALGGGAGDGIKAQVLTDLCHAAVDLVSNSASGDQWSVWSRVGAGAIRHITHGWCDARFATQRRRRDKAVERSLWP